MIIYFDMDGVLVDYPKTGKPKSFAELEPIDGAVEFFNWCREDGRFDVFIASTAPWSNPQAWMDKRLWVEEHLGDDAYKRLILTHNKNLLIGDVLIDDRPNNGAREFKGDWIHFHKDLLTWDTVRDIIEDIYSKKMVDRFV